MIGQGGPRASLACLLQAAISAAVAWAWRFAPAFALLLVLSSTSLKAEDLRVRIAWGGGEERVWHGTISVSEGSLAELRPLGVEADEPGSIWLEGNPGSSQEKLVVQQRSPRGYDGVDVLVSAPATAKLLVQFSAEGDRPIFAETKIGTVPVDEIGQEGPDQFAVDADLVRQQEGVVAAVALDVAVAYRPAGGDQSVDDLPRLERREEPVAREAHQQPAATRLLQDRSQFFRRVAEIEQVDGHAQGEVTVRVESLAEPIGLVGEIRTDGELRLELGPHVARLQAFGVELLHHRLARKIGDVP